MSNLLIGWMILLCQIQSSICSHVHTSTTCFEPCCMWHKDVYLCNKDENYNMWDVIISFLIFRSSLIFKVIPMITLMLFYVFSKTQFFVLANKFHHQRHTFNIKEWVITESKAVDSWTWSHGQTSHLMRHVIITTIICTTYPL